MNDQRRLHGILSLGAFFGFAILKSEISFDVNLSLAVHIHTVNCIQHDCCECGRSVRS